MARGAAALVAGAVALLAAGCGGGEAEGPVAVTVATPERWGVADPGPGAVLTEFVRAAGRGDARGMWALLSVPSRRTLGTTFPNFRVTTGAELIELLGPLTRERVVLSQRLEDGFAVAAVEGMVYDEDDGEDEPFAYAVAFRRGEGRWKVDLGGAVVDWLRPSPLDTVDDRPVVGMRAETAAPARQLLLWLDGEPYGARAWSDGEFIRHLEARTASRLAPGTHVAVGFVATDGAAAAAAWPFLVEG